MDAGIAGKSAVVTGGASGIGKAIAVGLAAEGVNVLIADRADGRDAVDAIAATGVRAHQIVVDLSTRAGVHGMVASAVDRLGGIDMYVNCAAVYLPESATRITERAWAMTLDTNLGACVWGCQAMTRHFIARGRGSILIVGSTVTHAPAYGATAYRVSKVGLKSHMETMAIEVAPFGIRVNMLTPGAFDTALLANLSGAQRQAARDAVPLGRREAQPREISASAIFLLSDLLSPYTTGADLVVDGGLTLHPFGSGDEQMVLALNDARSES